MKPSLFAIVLSCLLAASSWANSCTEDLSPRVVQIKAKYPAETLKTTQAILERILVGRNPRQTSFHYRQHLETRIFRSLSRIREYERYLGLRSGDPLRDLREELISSIWSTGLDREKILEAYDDPRKVQAYEAFLGGVQLFLSTTMVGYGVMHSDLDPFTPQRVLDLGSGPGPTAESVRLLMPKSKITLGDLSFNQLNRASQRLTQIFGRKRPISAARLDFGETLPFKEGSFDWVVSICAANQYLNTRAFISLLQDVLRILRPGGYFLFDFGPHSRAMDYESWLRENLATFRLLGFETETDPSLILAMGERRAIPILLKKPLVTNNHGY